MTKNFDKGIKNVFSSLRGLTKGFADINGAVMVAKAGFDLAQKAVGGLIDEIERLDSLGDTAERLSITADSLVKLQRAAENTGGEIEGIGKSLMILQRSLGDAFLGGSGPAKALDRLALSADQLVDISLDQAFVKIVDRISQLPTPAERASVAADLFGKSAGELGGLMTAGASAIAEATAEVDYFGQKLDEVRLRRIDQTKKSIGQLEMAWEGLKTEMAFFGAPVLATGANAAAVQLRNHRELFNAIDSAVNPTSAFGGLQSPFRTGGSNVPIIPSNPVGDISGRTVGILHSLLSEFDHLSRAGLAVGGIQGAGNPGLDFIGGPSNRAFLQRAIGIDPLSAPGLRGANGGAGALEMGSLGAFQAVQQSRREDEMRRLQKQEVEETKKINQNLEKILDAGGLLLSLDLQG